MVQYDWAVAVVVLFGAVATANEDHASKINLNIAKLDSTEAVESSALVYAGGDNPLALTGEDFAQMYEDNKDLWGDMPARDAHLNYQRSMTGNVDSA
jgi:hypothetical protein